MKTRILWTTLIACSAFLGSNGDAAERRCDELGAKCLCSEPLDNDDTYTVYSHDPSDSTTNECGKWNSKYPGEGISAASVGFPSGSTVSHVLYMPQDRASNGKISYGLGTPEYVLTDKTLCVRSYRKYGRDHAPPGNVKIARMGHPDGLAWQSAWGKGAKARPKVTWVSRLNGFGEVGCNLGHTGDPSTHVQFTDCQSHWCRFEICSEHNSATNAFNVRARWTQVGGTKEMDSYLGLPNDSGSDCQLEGGSYASVIGSNGQNATIQMMEYTTTSPPDSAGGSIYLSHGMVAISDYDPDFWIGPAHEIEGAGENTPVLFPPDTPQSEPAPSASLGRGFRMIPSRYGP